MRTFWRVLLVLAISLTVLNLHTAVASAADVVDDPVGTDELVELVNADRLAAGLPLFAVRSDVSAIAFEHSQRMAAADDIFHNGEYFDSETRHRLGAKSRGENVALNRSVADAHERLMASPGHHANLVNPNFTVIGFAVVRSADGTAFITEDFLEPSGAMVVASAEPPVPAPVPESPSPTPAPTAVPPAPSPAAPRPKKSPAPPVAAAPAPLPAPAPPPDPPTALPPDPPTAPAEPAAESPSAPRSSDSGELAALDLSLAPIAGAPPSHVPMWLAVAAAAAVAAAIRAAHRRVHRATSA